MFFHEILRSFDKFNETILRKTKNRKVSAEEPHRRLCEIIFHTKTFRKSLRENLCKTNKIVLKVYEAINGQNENGQSASSPFMNLVSPNTLLSLSPPCRHTTLSLYHHTTQLLSLSSISHTCPLSTPSRHTASLTSPCRHTSSLTPPGLHIASLTPLCHQAVSLTPPCRHTAPLSPPCRNTASLTPPCYHRVSITPPLIYVVCGTF